MYIHPLGFQPKSSPFLKKIIGEKKKHGPFLKKCTKKEKKTHLGSECLLRGRVGLIFRVQAKYPFPTL